MFNVGRSFFYESFWLAPAYNTVFMFWLVNKFSKFFYFFFGHTILLKRVLIDIFFSLANRCNFSFNFVDILITDGLALLCQSLFLQSFAFHAHPALLASLPHRSRLKCSFSNFIPQSKQVLTFISFCPMIFFGSYYTLKHLLAHCFQFLANRDYPSLLAGPPFLQPIPYIPLVLVYS